MFSSEKPIAAIKIIFALIFAVSVTGLFYFSGPDRSESLRIEKPVPMEDWTVTDPDGRVFSAGSSYRNNDLVRGTFTMVSKLPEGLRDDSCFCFINGGDVSIYVNGELRKDFIEKRDVPIPGGCVKRFYMPVPLHGSDSGAEIRIERIGTTRSGYVYQEAMVFRGGGLYAYLISCYGLSLALSGLLLIFSFITVIISIAMLLVYRRRIELFYGAMSILVISAWLVTNSYLYPFMFGHYHIDGVLNYMLCLMMPFNLTFYLDALQRGRYRKIMNAVLILGAISLILWPILHFTGVIAFPRALIYIDIILGIQIFVVMGVLLADTVRGNIREYRYTAAGFIGFLICGMIEIVVLNFVPVLQDDIPMLAGLAILLALAVVQQIHDLRVMRDERQRAVDLSEAKTRFLASMSHEIRTPINSVLGMNEMILRENKDPVIDEYAKSVRSSGKMLLMLVNDVLDFSRIEAGKMEINSAEYRMSALLGDTMPMMYERADEKNIDLTVRIPGDVPDGQVSDEFRIRQILINLINNAIKYTDEGSVTLTLSGEYTGADLFLLRLTVTDTGRGISEEGQKNLFDAFSRADLSRNGSIEGTGLGLAIVKNIVDSMNGTIRVSSRLGEGSEFTVELPVGAWDKKPVREDYMRLSEVSPDEDENCGFLAPEASILAVDDNNSNLKIVKLFLKRAGIVPDTSDNGRKAIELCRAKKYDLILLDHMMPEPDGIQTLQAIRTDDGSLNKDTPVVVLTANAVAGSRQIYLEAGFDDYITKPLDSGLLEQTVRKFLPADKVFNPRPAVSGADRSAHGTNVETLTMTGPDSTEARLRSIEGLDYEVALSYAGNSVEFLEELLGDIADECDTHISNMRKAIEDNDMVMYQREAHSIKGLMSTIGLNRLGERAKRHEEAARDLDTVYIRDDSEEFFAQYKETCDRLVRK